MKMTKTILTAGLSTMLLAGCAPKKSDSDVASSPTELQPSSDTPTTTESIPDTTETIVQNLQTEMKKVEQSPSLTVILVLKGDVQKTIATIKKREGKVVYDPNNGYSSSIPFIIAELTPDMINDMSFMSSLKLKAASIDSKISEKKIIQNEESILAENYSDFIPTESVKVDALGERDQLGKGVTVAVIDTGIDASHPAFGNRVVYWYDGTQETRTELAKLETEENTVKLNDKKITLPKSLEGFDGEIYGTVMSEKKYITQLAQATRFGKGYLDLNFNNSSDDFNVLVTKKENELKVYFDVDADGEFNEEESKALIDYNETTYDNRAEGMVNFPSRNNPIAYPVLLENESDTLYINLGRPEGSHGTHVAGIIAANEPEKKLLGAAPQADLMSLRVCSGISCTDSAIIKGLYKAFYNGKVIPDVVNISLGSHEQDSPGVYPYIFNDLSAKFGTIFFISASNSGPGFRTLNHFGNSGAVVMVGANVSKQTLSDQYNLPEGTSVKDENLLFFSSLGPSYTSEMKPNIVAPGGAIASIPAVGGYMAQMNGTSMSSPLAAGAFASVLAKTRQDVPAEFEAIDTMRAKNLEGTKVATQTLLPYVYLMRDTLMRGAKSLEDLTRVQQGYGLLQADKTYELLSAELPKLNQKEIDYFEIVINNFEQSYDRSGFPSPIQPFKLTAGEDGERTKSSLANILAAGVDVELDRVEVLDSKGAVKLLSDKSKTNYFSMVELGDSSVKATQSHVAFNNSRNNFFYSQRSLDKMEVGKSYLAHYKIQHKGVNVGNIIDVVHKPYKLEENKVDVPAISTALSKVKKGFGISKTKIAANDFHRYPILVDEKTLKLAINVALATGEEGRLFVQLYNPKGEEVAFTAAQDSPVTSYLKSSEYSTTTKDGKVMTGVWELTISTASSTWLADTEYEVLVQGSGFGMSGKSIELSGSQVVDVPVTLDGDEVTHVIIQGLQKVKTETVKVKSNYTSFHPMAVDVGYIGAVGFKIVTAEENAHWGMIRPQLYMKQGEDFVPLRAMYMKVPNQNAFVFPFGVPEGAYFAIDTITNYTETKSSQAKVDASINVEVITTAKEELNIEHAIRNYSDLEGAVVYFRNNTPITESFRAVVYFISGKLNYVQDINGEKTLVFGSGNKAFGAVLNIK